MFKFMKKKRDTEHSVFSNIAYFVGLMFKFSPGLVIGELFSSIIRNLPSKLISVIGIKYIIDTVSEGKDMNRVYKAVLIIAGVLILSNVLSLLYREFYWNMAKERLYYRLNSTLYEKAHSLDLQNYDDPDFYNNFILTIESSSENIQGLLGMVQNYVANVITLIAISSVILVIDPVCLLIIFASIIIFMPLSTKIGKLQMGRRIDNTKFHRRSDYFQRIFYLQDYAKEVRMNNIRPLLMDRYNDAADDVIANQDKYWKKIASCYAVQQVGVQALGFMFVLPMYLGYCVCVKKTLSAGDFVATFNGAYSIAMSLNFLTVWASAVFSERAKRLKNTEASLKAISR